MNELYDVIYNEQGRLRPGFVLILTGTVLTTIGQLVALVRGVVRR